MQNTPMTQSGSSIRKCALVPSCIVFLVLFLGLQVLESTPIEECENAYEDVFDRYRHYNDTGVEPLETLIPELHSIKDCVGGRRVELLARLLDMESSILFKTRQYAAAQYLLESDLPGMDEVTKPRRMAVMHQRLALVYSNRGESVKALQEFVYSSRYANDLSINRGARLLGRIANRFRHMGDFTQAVQYYDWADSLLDSAAVINNDIHIERARLRTYRAATHMDRADRERKNVQHAGRVSIPLLQRALSMLADIDDVAYERTQALNWLANAYRRAGRYRESLEAAHEAVRVAEPHMRTYPHWTSWAELEKGRTYRAMGEFDTARIHLLRALQIDREVERRDFELETLIDIGLLEEDAADPSVENPYEVASRYYEDAIELYELTRKSIGTVEWSAALFNELQVPYRRQISLLIAEKKYNEAFALLDETRARYLRDLRQANLIKRLATTRVQVQVDSLEELLDDTRYQLMNSDLSAEQQGALEHQLVAAQQEFDSLIGFTPEAPPALNVEAVQLALQDQGATLVTYFLDNRDSYILALNADTLVVKPVSAPGDSLSSWIAEIAPKTSVGGLRQDLNRPLRELYRSLVEPVEDTFADGQRVIFVPESELTGLPFAALLSDSIVEGEPLPYLIRTNPVSLELSMSLFLEEADDMAEKVAGNLLAMGRSDFEQRGSSLQRSAAEGLHNLPFVPEELDNIKDHVPEGLYVLNSEATETLVRERLPEQDVVHIASHAIVKPELPLYSFISLWDTEHDDGSLFLYELQNLPLSASLVVLSGCSTARGEGFLGEGMIGLQHAFRAAGARSILATLWQVDDRAMAILMDGFYEQLSKGITKDEALRRAQLDYLDSHQGVEANPYFWASAVLYGNANAVEWSRSRRSIAQWVLLGVVLLAIGFFIPRLRPRSRPA